MGIPPLQLLEFVEKSGILRTPIPAEEEEGEGQLFLGGGQTNTVKGRDTNLPVSSTATRDLSW